MIDSDNGGGVCSAEMIYRKNKKSSGSVGGNFMGRVSRIYDVIYTPGVYVDVVKHAGGRNLPVVRIPFLIISSYRGLRKLLQLRNIPFNLEPRTTCNVSVVEDIRLKINMHQRRPIE